MLDINHLTKRYGKFLAVNDLNLHIDKGEIFGFVGPNGAGKTTTMKIVCGLLDATAGSVTVDGVDALKCSKDIKRKVGYVPDFFGVYDNLKTMEYMEFFGSMYGMSKEDVDEVADGLLELVNLSDKKDVFVDTLSRGMKQRLCVARALIHNPDLLVLDEPNSGLDPRARFEMKEVLKNLGSMGKTIIISSHILPELSEMCTSIGIMDKGHLVTAGHVDEIMNNSGGASKLHIQIVGMDNRDDIRTFMAEQPNVTKVNFMEDEVLVSFNGGEMEAANLLKNIIGRGIAVSGFYKEKENLESLFLEITGGSN
ncbi:MAG: ABC transporter ATP-binding protein [Lachnospiraceae bacterium]|jgi:ABC-2 type transport system ATP-binding protein|nr:ABC transporter ATP-binding protein [Lachnospiraceae bacterium]